MRHRSRRASTFGRPERGASALLLVLGVTTVLMILGVAAATAVRHELRLSRVEASAEQLSLLVESGFSMAVKAVTLDSTWPKETLTKDSLPCHQRSSPDSTWSASPPRFCIDALPSRKFRGVHRAVPIRVAVQATTNDVVRYSYGWIVVDYTKNPARVVEVVPNRAWCDPAPGGCIAGG